MDSRTEKADVKQTDVKVDRKELQHVALETTNDEQEE